MSSSELRIVEIEVTKDYRLPVIYKPEYSTNEIREIALTLGAICVQSVLTEKDEKTEELRLQLIETKNKLADQEDRIKQVRADAIELAKRETEVEIARLRTKHATEVNDILERERTRLRTQFEREKTDLIAGYETITTALQDSLTKIEDKYRNGIETRLAKFESSFEEINKLSSNIRCLEQLSINSLRDMRSDMNMGLRQVQDSTIQHISSAVTTLSAVQQSQSMMICGAKSSSNLGREFEETIANFIRQAYGSKDGFQLHDVHDKGHTGDLILEYGGGIRIMIELKNYSAATKVPAREVEKLVRDLSSDSSCHAAIMISANSEITGHYTCGNFDLSYSLARVPILFVNNFMNLGEPLVLLHMIRVFIDMISHINLTISLSGGDPADSQNIEREKTECLKKCAEFIIELDKQSGEIMKNINLLQTTILSLKKTVSNLIEGEINKFESIKRLLSTPNNSSTTDDQIDLKLFRPPHAMTQDNLVIAKMIMEDFNVTGNMDQLCSTKDLVSYITTKFNLSEKRSREIIKSIFLDHHLQQRGYVTGLSILMH